MKPKPFSALNHFTVPCATCAPTFRACGRPLLTGEPGLALRPSDTNVELEPRETVEERAGDSTSTYRISGSDDVSSPDPVRLRSACFQPIRPADRTDFSDGSTRCVGPTTGSSGSRVFRPSPVLRTTVSLAGSRRPSPTS